MKPYHKNPRTLTERQRRDLARNLRELGDLSGIVHDLNTDEIIGGNQRSDIIKINECEIVLTQEGEEPDEQGTVSIGYVIWQDAHYNYRAVRWTPKQCEKANIIANKAGGDFDFDMLANQFEIPELLDWGFESWELGVYEEKPIAGNHEPDEENKEDDPLPDGVPDTIWPTDNDFGIPMLDITRQADAFDLPIETWGAKGRTNSAGTYHFYTEDYRFNNLWQRPNKPIDAGCVNLVEPNFSLYRDFPQAVAIWRTYQKRWLARYWQSCGKRIFVDLNVNPSYYETNMMGVPKGWNAYATRGYSDRLSHTEDELNIAEQHAGGPVLFLVYGGGKQVKAWCLERAERGVVWASEDMDKAKGKYTDF